MQTRNTDHHIHLYNYNLVHYDCILTQGRRAIKQEIFRLTSDIQFSQRWRDKFLREVDFLIALNVTHIARWLAFEQWNW